jgi:outer membrane autotransporter protein
LDATGTIATSSGVANAGTFTIAADKTIDSLTGAGATTLGGILTIGDATGTSGTYTGVASGAGGITKEGAGTLTLSGNNTYSGGTILTAGTLEAGHDNAFGNLAADTLTLNGGTLQASGAARTLPNNVTLTSDSTITGVAAGLLTLNGTFGLGSNTLNVNGTGNVTIAQAISGTGGLSVSNTGGGNLTLSALNTYTGPTTVSTGGLLTVTAGMQNWNTMTVDGTVAGDVTNSAGATLGGSGTITGNLVNNGTVNPGNSPGTITVGTYTVNPGATHVVEIASASSYDKLVATAAGGVTLNGGTLSPRLLGGYLPPVNQIFPNIISNTGGGAVTGTFATVENTRIGNSRTLFWQALYNASSVDLQAVGNYAPADLSLSSNQRSVANMLNALPLVTSGDLFEVLNAINALTNDDAVRGAFNEISPQKYAALPTLAFPVTHMQFQYLRNRLARQRWEAKLGSDAVSSGGGGFMRGFNFGYDSTKMLLASSNFTVSDAGNPLIRQGVNHRWGIYLEPMANWGSLRPSANLVGYHYKNFGFTLGADYWVTNNWLVGVNTGYSKTLTGVGGTGGDINANVIPFNAYSAFFVKGFYVNGTLGYTFSNYNMERNVAFGTINRTAKANTSGNQFQAAAETGYDIKVGKAIIGPTVSLQYATQTTGGFTESNAGSLSLRVDSQTADSLQTGVGARASYRAKVGNVTVKPQVAVVWQHEFSNDTRGVNARLAQGSATMNWRTDKIGQNFAVVSVDVPARISKNLVANIGYTAEVGRSKSSNQGINLGLRYEF